MKKTEHAAPPNDITAMTEQTFQHFDSRVIARKRDVAMFELAATDEHIIGLRASLAEQTKQRDRLKARIAGMTAALGKRGA